jgi:hypothetical protein
MKAGRALAWTAVLAATPAVVWCVLNYTKKERENDLLSLSRSLMEEGGAGDEEAQARLALRFRLPFGNPDRQDRLYERLWYVLRTFRPDSVQYGDTTPTVAEDGETRQHRQVLIEGTDRDGDRRLVTLEWLAEGGDWFLYDFETRRMA